MANEPQQSTTESFSVRRAGELLGYLGTDTKGREHWVDDADDRILVFEDVAETREEVGIRVYSQLDGDLETTVDLEGRPVEVYQQFVESECGWADKRRIIAPGDIPTEAI